MKRIITSIAIGVALATVVLWAFPVTGFAGPIKRTVSIATTTSIGGDRLSTTSKHSNAIPVPFGKPFAVYISNWAGGHADADSMHFFVETKPSGAGDFPLAGHSWLQLWRMAVNLDSTDFPLCAIFLPNWADSTTTLPQANAPGCRVVRGTSLGQIRFTICGSDYDSTTNAAGTYLFDVVTEVDN